MEADHKHLRTAIRDGWSLTRQVIELREAMKASDTEFGQLVEAYWKNIDELAKARLKTDEDLLAEFPFHKSTSDEEKRDILEWLRHDDLRRARVELIGPLKFTETIDEILARMARAAEMAAKIRQEPQKSSENVLG